MRKLGIVLVVIAVLLVGIPGTAVGTEMPPFSWSSMPINSVERQLWISYVSEGWTTSQAAQFAKAMGDTATPPTITPANVTVGQVAAATGQSPATVVGEAVRVKQMLKVAPEGPAVVDGAAAAGVGSAGSLGPLAVMVVGSWVLSKGAEWLSNQVFGEIRYYDASGNPMSWPFESFAKYMWQGDSWFFSERFDEEIEYLLPGFEIATPGAGYSFTKVLEAGVQPQAMLARSWAFPPHAAPLNTTPWSTDANDVATLSLFTAMDPDIYPIVPNWTISPGPDQFPHVSAGIDGWRNQVTGEDHARIGSSRIYFNTNYLSRLFDVVYTNTTNATTLETQADDLEGWYNAQIAAMEASGSITALEGVPETAAPVPMDFPDPGSLPSVTKFSDDWDENTPLSEIVDGSSTPSSLPAPMQEDLPDVDPETEQLKDTVIPALRDLRISLYQKAPFAYVSVLAGAFSGEG